MGIGGAKCARSLWQLYSSMHDPKRKTNQYEAVMALKHRKYIADAICQSQSIPTILCELFLDALLHQVGEI